MWLLMFDIGSLCRSLEQPQCGPQARAELKSLDRSRSSWVHPIDLLFMIIPDSSGWQLRYMQVNASSWPFIKLAVDIKFSRLQKISLLRKLYKQLYLLQLSEASSTTLTTFWEEDVSAGCVWVHCKPRWWVLSWMHNEVAMYIDQSDWSLAVMDNDHGLWSSGKTWASVQVFGRA